jgi:hypothetical protein
MAKRTKNVGVSRLRSGEYRIVGPKGSVYVDVTSEKAPDGREFWRVVSGDRIFNLSTSSSSTSIMDEAVRIYWPALERLAKR